ncbi:MAG: hypothetical protein IIW75_06475 [Bacteroidaceae bacterium]|nr:hypothetical protein [Bacteroidaceae bacterium]
MFVFSFRSLNRRVCLILFYSTSGSTRTYSITDVTGSYAGGSTISSTEDSYAAAGIKCDNNFTLSGGSSKSFTPQTR